MIKISIAYTEKLDFESWNCGFRIDRSRHFGLGHCNLLFIWNLALVIWDLKSFILEFEEHHHNFKAANHL